MYKGSYKALRVVGRLYVGYGGVPAAPANLLLGLGSGKGEALFKHLCV